MKLTDYIILFFFIFLSAIIMATISVNIDEAETEANRRYASTLASASESAVAALGTDTLQNGYIWKSEENKEKALTVFFKTINYGFNSENKTKANETHAYLPVILMIDTDGYYITYNSAFDEDGNSIRPDIDSVSITSKAYEESMSTSPLISWTGTYGSFTIRYYLNDTVDLYTPGGTIYSGKREIVLQEMEDAAENDGLLRSKINSDIYRDDGGINYSLIDMLKNKNQVFDNEKNTVIVDSILEETEYYVNNQNMLAKGNDIPYIFEMPDISGEDWHRLLSNPTFIAFMQGYQTVNWTSFVNVYALAGGEIIKQRQYFITEENGEKLYHLLSEDNKKHTIEIKKVQKEVEVNYAGDTVKRTVTEDEYYYVHDNGVKEKIDKIYTSMEQCAYAGADACECAISNN